MWESVLSCASAPFVLYWLQNIADDNHPGLSGTMRSTFVEGAIGTCLKKANGDPANKGISPSIISQYCNCYANLLADSVSIKELKALSHAESDAVRLTMAQPQIDAAANHRLPNCPPRRSLPWVAPKAHRSHSSGPASFRGRNSSVGPTNCAPQP